MGQGCTKNKVKINVLEYFVFKERKRRTSGESGSDSGPTPSRKKPRSNSTIENSSDTSVITNHTSPRKSGLVSRILDQPATIQRPVMLRDIYFNVKSTRKAVYKLCIFD